jgi:tripeptidyl-peptidase-1
VTAVGATQLPAGKSVNDSETAAYEDIFSGGGWSNVFSVPGWS